MATLALQITSGLGTNTTTLTFSAADSQRIFTAWQNKTQNPAGTQAQFTTWLGNQVQNVFLHLVTVNETTTPAAPAITSQTV